MNGDTKLSEALKYGPEILDYIISLKQTDYRLAHSLDRLVPWSPFAVEIEAAHKLADGRGF
jgi:hypothetical protein